LQIGKNTEQVHQKQGGGGGKGETEKSNVGQIWGGHAATKKRQATKTSMREKGKRPGKPGKLFAQREQMNQGTSKKKSLAKMNRSKPRGGGNKGPKGDFLTKEEEAGTY